VDSWIYAVLFGIAAIFGLHGSVRVTRRYRAVTFDLDWRERMVLLLLVGICWVITTTAFYVGILSIRQLLGFERLPQLIPLTSLLATLILFVPTVIDFVVTRVSRVPWR
jgi:hypothetical protein